MNGDAIWAWQELDEHGWGILAAGFSRDRVLPMVHRDRKIVDGLRVVAEGHQAATGNPVRLARFVLTEEELLP